jgi:hypothetical protein
LGKHNSQQSPSVLNNLASKEQPVHFLYWDRLYYFYQGATEAIDKYQACKAGAGG